VIEGIKLKKGKWNDCQLLNTRIKTIQKWEYLRRKRNLFECGLNLSLPAIILK
jgi:hypothetical protein